MYRKKDDLDSVVWWGSPSNRTCWKRRAVCGMFTRLKLLVNGTVLVVMRIVKMWWRWVVVESIAWCGVCFSRLAGVESSAVVIYIFTPSHLLLYIFTPSHLPIYIFTPSHLLIYITSADLHFHTFTSAVTSSHPHIC